MTEPAKPRPPTLQDVRAAAQFLRPLVVATPLLRCEALDRLAGAELWLKAENMQHVGAFKARGAQYAVGQLTGEQRARGVITYSSGNHAQAVALAAKRHGIRADIAMPEDAPIVKVEAVRALGAQIVFAGTTSEHRHAAALQLREDSGGTIIEPFDHPHIIAGQATATLELLDEVQARGEGPLDALLVPVGGGGLIAGACLVAAERGVKVYAVEPEGCDAMARSIAAGERVAVQPSNTIADGLKPVRVGALNFAIAKQHLAGALTVSEEQIGRAMITLLVRAKTLVEPSGAAALAAALSRQLPGEPKRIGVILSGGNIGTTRLTSLLRRFEPWPLDS